MESVDEISKRLQSVLLNQSIQSDINERHFYMYGHTTIGNDFYPAGWEPQGSVRMNIVQSCVETLVNKLSKNSPRPTFLTDNGDWGMRQKAIKREKFIFGQFYKSKVYEETKKSLYDCLVFGDGLVKVYSHGKDLKVEHALRMELFVDPLECLYGQPRSLWQVKYYDKDTLAALYPDKEKAIKAQKGALPPFYFNAPFFANYVQVVEYWKLPVKQGDKYVGGQHTIYVGNEALVDEEYKRPRFPFAKLGFVKNLVGWWSKGVAEIVTSYQIEINRTLKRMSDAFRLVAAPKVIYDMNSGIVKTQWNNDVGAMLGWDSRTGGAAPQFVTPQAVGQDYFVHLENTVQRAYAEVGLSELSVGSKKPEGLDSGKALREYNDLETERFAAIAKSWEQYHLDIADLVLEECKAISEEYGDYAILSPDKKGCQLINFKDIDMEKDSYVIQTYPSSMLPKLPAGRLAYVQELIASNLVSPEVGRSLLEFPDIDKFMKLENSPLEDILATIDYMLDENEYLPPEPYQSLEVGMKYMNSAYLYYKNQKCPEERLDLLLRWINDAMILISPPPEPEMTSSDLVLPEQSAEVPMEQPVAPPVEGALI